MKRIESGYLPFHLDYLALDKEVIDGGGEFGVARLGILEGARRRILIAVGGSGRVGQLGGFDEETAAGAMPAGATGLVGLAGALMDGHGVEDAAVGRALDTERIAVESPAAAFHVQGCAVDGIQPAEVIRALATSIGKGGANRLPIHEDGNISISHWGLLPVVMAGGSSHLPAGRFCFTPDGSGAS